MADSDERWQSIRKLFHSAMEHPPERRREFLRGACGDDDDLFRRVLALIEHADTPDEQFGGIVRDAAADAMQTDRPEFEQRIGNYRLLEIIGTGGMGNVYLAERADEHYEQRVAIKLLHPGHGDRALVTRFRAERQMLARLEHPNIGRLLDGGETDAGISYLVMEYVDGRPVDRYCDEQQLTIPQRLRLFQKICSAVGYAHRNLVVHRDIKPSNILVTSDGEPKLLDFGIAKLLDEDAAAFTAAFTREGAGVMTPEYASPEQVRSEPVTTATDIYSLGVLLYRILCGRMPYRSRALNSGLARAILTEIPSRPSAALTPLPGRSADDDEMRSIGTARQSSLQGLVRRLQGDLDNIALKALRKEPELRYPTAAAFADDIENYLSFRPVSARPASLGYRSVKFLRRYRTGVAVGVAVAALIAVSVVQIVQQRDKARIAALQSEQVVRFLGNLFVSASPLKAQGDTITARDLLQTGVADIGKLDNQPQVQARLLEIMGTSFSYIGDFDRAKDVMQRALTIRRQRLPYDAAAISENLREYSDAYRLSGDFDEAERMLRDALAVLDEASAESRSRRAYVMARLGLVLRVQGRQQEALDLLEKAAAIKEALGETDDPDAIDIYGNLANALDDAGRLAEAESMNRKVVAASRKTLGDKDPNTVIRIGNLGLIQTRRGDYAEALKNIDEAYASIHDIWQSNPRELHWAARIKALLYEFIGRFADALQLREEQQRLARDYFGPDSHEYARALMDLGELRLITGKTGKANALLDEALAAEENAGGADTASFRIRVAMARNAAGDFPAAEAVARQALSSSDELPVSTKTSLQRELARALSGQGRYDEAGTLFDESLRAREAVYGPDGVSLLPTLTAMSKHYRHAGRPDLALRYARRAREIGLAVTPPGTWEPALANAEYGLALLAAGHAEDAGPIVEAAIADLTGAFGEADARIAEIRGDYRALSR